MHNLKLLWHNARYTISAVSATEVCTPIEVGALGCTLCLDVTAEGVQVEALVDFCSEVTIHVISRSLLHKIRKSCKERGDETFTSVGYTVTGTVWQDQYKTAT